MGTPSCVSRSVAPRPASIEPHAAGLDERADAKLIEANGRSGSAAKEHHAQGIRGWNLIGASGLQRLNLRGTLTRVASPAEVRRAAVTTAATVRRTGGIYHGRRKMSGEVPMHTRALFATTAVAVMLLLAGPLAGDRLAVQRQTLSRAEAAIAAGVARLYDTSKLHRIDIEIPPADAETLIRRTSARVRATVSVDGVRLENVGVRQAGWSYHSYQPITNKPSLSLKFDEFVAGQSISDTTS